ncbi:hypothetical protein HDU89_006229 [Geranomyces variabilis]|nr:hypothetical protein HDU89_006229 [Geranomyces variabilis]
MIDRTIHFSDGSLPPLHAATQPISLDPATPLALLARLPETIQVPCYRIWVFQVGALLAWCTYHRRFWPVPWDNLTKAPPPPSAHEKPKPPVQQLPFAVRQFHLYLIAQGALFIAELCFTSIVRLDPIMALHHIVAFGIFALMKGDRTSMSVTTVFPYFLHCLYGSLVKKHIALLAVYNVVFLLACSLELLRFLLPQRHTPIHLGIPTTGMLEVLVNMWWYRTRS